MDKFIQYCQQFKNHFKYFDKFIKSLKQNIIPGLFSPTYYLFLQTKIGYDADLFKIERKIEFNQEPFHVSKYERYMMDCEYFDSISYPIDLFNSSISYTSQYFNTQKVIPFLDRVLSKFICGGPVTYNGRDEALITYQEYEQTKQILIDLIQNFDFNKKEQYIEEIMIIVNIIRYRDVYDQDNKEQIALERFLHEWVLNILGTDSYSEDYLQYISKFKNRGCLWFNKKLYRFLIKYFGKCEFTAQFTLEQLQEEISESDFWYKSSEELCRDEKLIRVWELMSGGF